MNATIIIATHKEYPMPDDSMYLPVHAGKAISNKTLPYQGDDTGEHISGKNPHYCELTALYWAWKNIDSDYIGLVHYRRHFTLHNPLLFIKNKFPYVLKHQECEKLLSQYDILLPRPRNYFIETNYSHYIHAHPAESMDMTRDIINTLYPEYIPAFDTVMKRTKAHMFNMFLMKKNIFSSYCEWLFSVLSALETKLDIFSYDAYNQRIFGFVSELLLDVYIEKNHLPYAELPVMFMENEHWLKKSFLFLKRKFIYKK